MNKVDHPSHYGGDNPYEVIKVIEAWELPFHLSNAIKYIYRCDKKGSFEEDIEKAIWYLNRFKELIKTKKIKTDEKNSK